MDHFKFLPSFEIELVNQSPENLAKLKSNNLDIFRDFNSESKEYGLKIDFDKIDRYINI